MDKLLRHARVKELRDALLQEIYSAAEADETIKVFKVSHDTLAELRWALGAEIGVKLLAPVRENVFMGVPIVGDDAVPHFVHHAEYWTR